MASRNRRSRLGDRRRIASAFVAALALHLGCGLPPTSPLDRRFDRVMIVVLENRDYDDIMDSPRMGYLNELARDYALATEFYADVHPSVGNYIMMTVGDTITDNGSYNGTISHDNVVRRLAAAGKTWKSYAEDIPSTGYLGGDRGLYARRHNPFVWFSDVKNNESQRNNIRNYNEFRTDLDAGRLPNYVFIVPNLCNDGHDCADNVVDRWLRANIPPIIHSPSFHNTVLIITYDEAEYDNTAGGGRIVWVAISPRAKRGYKSSETYQFASVLRFSLEALGISSLPNAAARAPSMWEFFDDELPPPPP